MPVPHVSSVRIIADDLTGALDCAAPFTAVLGPIAVYSGKPPCDEPSYVLNIRTREMPEAAAGERARDAARLWRGADCAFKKIDSLLRGSVAAEIAASIAGFDRCVIAPAFPAQGRVTRKARQWRLDDGQMRPLPVDLRGELARHGVEAAIVESVTELKSSRARTMVCDATHDADLAAIVETVSRLPGRTLWCGSSGLARALAGVGPRQMPAPSGTTLIVIGSINPVAIMQKLHLEAQGVRPFTLDGKDDLQTEAIHNDLSEYGLAVVDFGFDAHCPPQAVDRGVASAMQRLRRGLSPPDHLIVVGGETLDLLCVTLDAGHLRVEGEWLPGLPVSVVADGPWANTTLYSKSGAFGEADLLWKIVGGQATPHVTRSPRQL